MPGRANRWVHSGSLCNHNCLLAILSGFQRFCIIVDRHKDEHMDGQTDRHMDGWTNGQTLLYCGRKYGLTDGQTYGWMDKRTDPLIEMRGRI